MPINSCISAAGGKSGPLRYNAIIATHSRSAAELRYFDDDISVELSVPTGIMPRNK
jgi:hypothetical protein